MELECITNKYDSECVFITAYVCYLFHENNKTIVTFIACLLTLFLGKHSEHGTAKILHYSAHFLSRLLNVFTTPFTSDHDTLITKN